jgi:hypothetical protein
VTIGHSLIPERLLDLEAEDVIRIHNEPNPAVGAAATVEVPGGQIWEILGIRFGFTCDATVATRRVFNEYSDDGGRTWTQRWGLTMAASESFAYCMFRDLGYRVTGNENSHIAQPCPYLILLPGWFLRADAVNKQAGDTITDMRVYLRERPLRGASAELRHSIDRLAERLELLGPLIS